ncbi:MAG: hypothetical protein ACR2P9_02340 [Gammaproteobacteria bacterium]
MSRFYNKDKKEFLQNLPSDSLEGETCTIPARLKFNFSLLDISQKGTESFESLREGQRKKLIKKIVELSREPRRHWEEENLLAIYGEFPTKKSNFKHPKHVPHDVEWARFRIESDFRLAGFFVPKNFHDKEHEKLKVRFDSNTFYAVFIDPEHNFYKQ